MCDEVVEMPSSPEEAPQPPADLDEPAPPPPVEFGWENVAEERPNQAELFGIEGMSAEELEEQRAAFEAIERRKQEVEGMRAT